MAGYYAHVTFGSVLPPAEFQQLTIGQTRAELAGTLPPRRRRGGDPAP
jgi:hypothetical protein